MIPSGGHERGTLKEREVMCAVDSGVLQIMGSLSLDPSCALCLLPPQVKLLSSTGPALSQDGNHQNLFSSTHSPSNPL